MNKSHKIIVHNKQINRTISIEVPHGEYILRYFESQGEDLPFSCRNGCCTTCAVKVLSGDLDQSLGIGLSKEMQDKGYALLCIAKAIGPLEVETQDEDEVYEKQFGKFLSDMGTKAGNPFDI
ncbi:2Fe-2S iron-sulfur cluster-binding protein [Prochlorococcus marinus]|uniref:Ferredoxin n=1 Tax=Prochlorococcus marinus (strain MIT 9211) TaxID=93059 RepID=A9BAI9_PROM4|nr:2Fe-2S iron-sulfur cluster-binding protein [Prochlorococcus marinus]ABX08851.1 Ferredoxin [Prochlorococcus marinus str. MIT 9211]